MMPSLSPALAALCILASALPALAQQAASFPVKIEVDAARPTGPLKPIWRFFGADEPNYTYMKDGKKLLSEIAKLSPVPVYVRTHNLLTTGDGTPALKWGSTNHKKIKGKNEKNVLGFFGLNLWS